MQSKAATVKEYLASLPPDRRAAVEAVRGVIRKNLDKDYEEGMQYGMIGYYVPFSVFPDGYHCDPRQPLPFAGLASQKGHMSLYGAAGSEAPEEGTELGRWFREAWARSGKKIDMGKACIRFKKLEDLPLDVIGEAIRRVPTKRYIELYTASRASAAEAKTARKAGGARPKAAASTASESSRSQPKKAAATKSVKKTAKRPKARS